MTIWKKFKLVPWTDIFSALVKRQILIVEKPLAKEMWR
jgi:hypothetical protein